MSEFNFDDFNDDENTNVEDVIEFEPPENNSEEDDDDDDFNIDECGLDELDFS